MSVLLWLVFVGILVFALSLSTLLVARRWGECSVSHRILLLIAGPIDGVLTGLVLSWMGASTLTMVAGSLLVGIMSMLFVQPLLVPQRLLVWRLAKENIRRRKRQSALMIAGLVISSAIITSSLVVGDSLDATVGQEVQAAWGETDVLMAGVDPMTGLSVEFGEDVAVEFWERLQNDTMLSSHLDGRQYGVVSTVSLAAENGRAEPSVPLFARNVTVDDEGIWAPLDPSTGLRFSELHAINMEEGIVHVVLNDVAAETLEVAAGER
ncbi:MAG: hypothetical protein ACPG7K_04650, partial [Poseidonia sp.]